MVTQFPLDFRKIAQGTASDMDLRELLHFVRTTWPRSPKDIANPVVRRYFAQRHDLTVHRDVLLLRSQSGQTRVVIVKSLRREVLTLLHQGHWGLVRTKQLARQRCTWPGMDRDIEQLTAQCSSCIEHQSAPPQKFAPWPKPSAPWQLIHLDFGGPFWGT